MSTPTESVTENAGKEQFNRWPQIICALIFTALFKAADLTWPASICSGLVFAFANLRFLGLYCICLFFSIVLISLSGEVEIVLQNLGWNSGT